MDDNEQVFSLLIRQLLNFDSFCKNNNEMTVQLGIDHYYGEDVYLLIKGTYTQDKRYCNVRIEYYRIGSYLKINGTFRFRIADTLKEKCIDFIDCNKINTTKVPKLLLTPHKHRFTIIDMAGLYAHEEVPDLFPAFTWAVELYLPEYFEGRSSGTWDNDGNFYSGTWDDDGNFHYDDDYYYYDDEY